MADRFVTITDPVEFQHVVGCFLHFDPVRHTLPLTILDQILTRGYREWLLTCVVRSAQDIFLTSRHDSPLSASDVDTGVVAVGIQTPPFNLVVAASDEQALDSLASGMTEAALTFPGVTGLDPWVQRFADAWTTRHGLTTSVTIAERLFRLDQIIIPPAASGSARQAQQDDINDVVEWILAFQTEAVPDDPTVDVADRVRAQITDGRIWLWQDNEEAPVSLVGHSPAVAGQARIGPVYTPPNRRRHGYAGNLTAHVSQRLLDRGTVPTLFTDLANPTSNAIYRAIGYTPVADAAMLNFQDA